MSVDLQDVPVLYINLEERKDRKTHIENLLRNLGMKNVMRVPAIKHEKGFLGCTMSHILATSIAKKRNYPAVCIIEDDMSLTTDKEQLVSNYNYFKEQNLPKDILFLGGNVIQAHPINSKILKLEKVCSSVAYIIYQPFYDIWIQNLKDSIKKNLPLDVYWQNLILQSNAYIVLPLCVSQLKGYSNIEKKVVDYDWLMLTFPKPLRLTERHRA